jgi:hypothetical protein
MTETLYHTSIGFPSTFRAPVGEFALAYTHHALRAALNDRYGLIDLPASLRVSAARIIEIGHDNYRTSKILYRLAYSDDLDLCIVVVPGVPMVVKTVWLQAKGDAHNTLDASRYATP